MRGERYTRCCVSPDGFCNDILFGYSYSLFGKFFRMVGTRNDKSIFKLCKISDTFECKLKQRLFFINDTKQLLRTLHATLGPEPRPDTTCNNNRTDLHVIFLLISALVP